MKFPPLSAFIFLLAVTAACAQPEPAEPPVPGDLQLSEAFPQLSFNRPVDLQHAGDNTNRLFVVEQKGVISVFKNETQAGEKSTFLDIESLVDDDSNEQGLLGLAFHPQYEINGYLYVNYTASNPNRTVISRFKVSTNDPNKADKASELVLLEFDQPYSNHNGGQLSFGPDGFLYIAVGDGGSGGDPKGHGQNRQTLLGSMLRIDVDKNEGAKNYGIPADNPFANNTQGYRPEIYAYGLRNPWRFSFDSETGQLWTADVGQNSYEEIDIIVKGGNYGWNTMEGAHCFKSGCDETGLELPVWEYGRSEGVSITGGYVYRGTALPQLEGQYIYADFATGRIWSLDVANPQSPINKELLKAGFNISSFGIDQNQELYICGFDGKIYKLEVK
ncbi:PQQ-dependent sugar dehydrogenase [Algoriphagus terrigena]|uniref:PQQ-dependent sugar dehydrogenase n=1 Tax=Algoriphagus terrigena TaxID=344884 RepID=UPI000421D3A8|nr:PQQ-dependent sugar dehydrogenase [Algoriphagus terrigena]